MSLKLKNYLCVVVVQSLSPTICDSMVCSISGCPSLSPRVGSNSCPWSQWCHPTILPLSSTSLPALNLSNNQSIFHKIHSFMYQTNKVLGLQLHHQNFKWIIRVDFLKDWLIWSSWCPRDSGESFPASQFQNIISLALSLLYVPPLTSLRGYMATEKW